MTLRRAYWINDAEARLEGRLYAVGYKHQLERVPVNPGETETFFQYRGHDEKSDRPGTAWEWGEDFKLKVQSSGKIIIAEPEWEGGKLLDAVIRDCYGEKLLIEVKPTPFETIKIGTDTLRGTSGWAPKGYADPADLWNDKRLRTV